MNTKGYTLLEVMLFLAISGAIALTAFVGLGPRLANARFTSSIRSLEANFTQEMQESQAGLNSRDGVSKCKAVSDGSEQKPEIDSGTNEASGTSNECVINGRLAVFKEKSVDYHAIVSLRKGGSNVGCENTSNYANMVTCYRPVVVRESESPAPIQYPYPYKARIRSTSPVTDFTDVAVNPAVAFGYITDPNTGVSYRFFHTKAGGDLSAESGINSGNTIISDRDTRYICLGLENRRAKLSFSTSSIKPTVEFEGTGC